MTQVVDHVIVREPCHLDGGDSAEMRRPGHLELVLLTVVLGRLFAAKRQDQGNVGSGTEMDR